MAGNLSPRTFRKKSDGKECKAMVLIASADAGVRRQWALGLQDLSAIHEVSNREGLERSMANSKPSVLLHCGLGWEIPLVYPGG
jgi:hypothetical protein